ncbi:MAG: transcription termination factor NusA [Clostridia bacterium]
MASELMSAIRQIERERGIEAEVLIEALEKALESAYKKNYGNTFETNVVLDRDTGDIRVLRIKTVVEEVFDDEIEISLADAQEYGEVEIGDELQFEEYMDPHSFGRIAAQTAKQVIMQKIREAEREKLYDIYDNKLKDIIAGVIRRVEKDTVYLDLGNTEAVMSQREQVASEHYSVGSRLKVYVTEVKKTNRGPRIYVSRTHPDLVKRLFELEVPEIQNGVVEIRAIAREAGSRTKIAVFSNDANVDASGACIGHKGIRVTAVVDELRGEKIDIIEWSQNQAAFISNSLSPADVIRVDIFEPDDDSDEDMKARVTVPDNQLSLAIGKSGQNARLAARLTGWKIDIIAETELRNIIEGELMHVADDKSGDAQASSPLDQLFMDNDASEDDEVIEDEADGDAVAEEEHEVEENDIEGADID